jgi:LAO/AO transport system kinase
VVNKADREGADRLVAAIESNLALQTAAADAWQPPIVKTIATSGTGVPELADAIWRFRAQSEASRAGRRQAHSAFRLRELVAKRFVERLEADALEPGELASVAARVAAREIDPYTAADELIARARPSAL